MNKSHYIVFKVYVFAYLFFFASRPLSDADIWWHLKTGEYIVLNHTIPRTDVFSFTNYGTAWVAHEWLSEAIFYSLYSRFGFRSLIFLSALLTALAFWIVVKQSNTHTFFRGFAGLLGVWTVLPTLGPRPRVFTLLLASIYLALLARYTRSGQGRALWWLVPLMVLWVNLHGGFLIGLVLIALAIVGLPLDALWAGEKVSTLFPRLRGLVLVFVGCLLAALLNPQVWRIYLFPFEIFLSRVQQQEVADWLSPNFHRPETLPLVILIMCTIVVFALSPKRARPSELLLFLATLYATLKSYRHIAIFALVAAPLLASYLQSWLVSTSFGRPFSRPTSADWSPRSMLFALLLLLPLVAFGIKLKSTIYAPLSQKMIGVPLKAVAFLREKHITGNTFTDPNTWGGHVIWELPSNPVYIDGRIDMYPHEFVEEYVNIIRGRIHWRIPFDRYGVRIAIVRPNSPLGRELKESTEWQQVFEDDLATVFTRH
jgi:hypothetical protein